MQTTRSAQRLAIIALAATALLAAPALGAPPTELAPLGGGLGTQETVGSSVFTTPPPTDPFNVFDGYDGGVYTKTRGDSITVSSDGFALERNGTYQIHVEGTMLVNPTDPTGSAEGGAMFAILVDGEVWASCATAPGTGIAAGAAPTPSHTQVRACRLQLTLEVRGNGHLVGDGPWALARGSVVQVAFIPNDDPIGESTFLVHRTEVTRIGR